MLPPQKTDHGQMQSCESLIPPAAMVHWRSQEFLSIRSPSNKKAGISGSCARNSWVPVPELLGWEWLRYVKTYLYIYILYILNWGKALQHWVWARWLWAHRASLTAEVGEETENHEKHSTYLNMGSLHASQTFHTFSLMVVICHIASMLICGGRLRPPPLYFV